MCWQRYELPGAWAPNYELRDLYTDKHCLGEQPITTTFLDRMNIEVEAVPSDSWVNIFNTEWPNRNRIYDCLHIRMGPHPFVCQHSAFSMCKCANACNRNGERSHPHGVNHNSVFNSVYTDERQMVLSSARECSSFM